MTTTFTTTPPKAQGAPTTAGRPTPRPTPSLPIGPPPAPTPRQTPPTTATLPGVPPPALTTTPAPAPTPTSSSTTAGYKHSILVPCVGGVLTLDSVKDHGEAFTSGSNITPPMGIPIFGNQRHPVDFRSLQMFEALLTKRAELKLSSPDEKQKSQNH